MEDQAFTPERALRRLEPYFSALHSGGADAVPEQIRGIARFRESFGRDERRVVLIGAANVGKSSLVNALLGAPLAPVAARPSGPVVTTVRFAVQPEVVLVSGEVVERTVAFDDFLAGTGSSGRGQDAAEVVVGVPHPLLGSMTLVDTPGYLTEFAHEEIVAQRVRDADLAIMVLAADKILSAEERRMAAWAREMLNGNIVFVVDRLDLVDDEDREDVLAWAAHGLRDEGNGTVGHARMFSTSLPPQGNGELPSGMEAVRDWLRDVFRSSAGDEIATLSRLGSLAAELDEASAVLGEERDRRRQALADLQAEEDRTREQERQIARRAIAEARMRMGDVRNCLGDLDQTFISRAVDQTLQAYGTGGSHGAIPLQLRLAADAYASEISDEVAAAFVGAPVGPGAFDLGSLIFELQVNPVEDPAIRTATNLGELLTRAVDGGSRGREAGEAVGGWIGRKVLGVDAQAETRRRVEALVRSALQDVRKRAEEYLVSVQTLLDQADEHYASPGAPSRRVTEADAALRYWTALLAWAEDFLVAVRGMIAQVERRSEGGSLGGELLGDAP